MSLKYNQVNIQVNGNNILAESLDMNESTNQKPIYTFNNNIPIDNVPTNLHGTISISYYLEPGNEPNYLTLSGILNDSTLSSPSIINIGNVYITGYLNNFSLQLAPSSLIKARCGFDIYSPFTGNLSAQNTGDWNLYNIYDSSGIAHYWSTKLLSGNSVTTNNNILQFSYQATINNSPIYGLGNPYPNQIYIQNVEESINILSENQLNSQFSGQLLDNIIPSIQQIQLRNISTEWSNSVNYQLTIPLTGFILKESKYNISIDNIVLFELNMSRYH
jgi:hypothetical protein